MGYFVSLCENNFSFDINKGEKVLECVKKGILEGEITRERWISFHDILNFDTVEELFEEIEYPLYKDGNKYKILDFTGEKWGGYEPEIFKAIEEYIDDCYLEFYGDDGDMWRYVYKNGKIREVLPTITWD